MTAASASEPWSQALRVASLPTRKPTRFAIRPAPAMLREIAAALDLTSLSKLSFSGEIRPLGPDDWELAGRLGATVVQPCVVTLAPVTTRIDEDVRREFRRDLPQFEAGSEVEMPADDTLEELGDSIDPGRVMVEALALALPLFPRAPGAELERASFTEPGKQPLSDDDVKPFAALQELRDKLSGDKD